MKLNTNEIKFLKFLTIILFLSTSIAIATETTWRHSGFEVTNFDINVSGKNITEVYLIELAENGTISPSVSGTNRAIIYYDSTNDRVKISENGNVFNTFLTNATILNTSTITVTRHANGSIGLSTVSSVKTLVNATQNYTIGATNTTGTLYTCHANSGTLNITLPTGVAGTEFSIKKKDGTANTCSVFSSQNIDGANYANISIQYNSIDIVFTSDEWSII